MYLPGGGCLFARNKERARAIIHEMWERRKSMRLQHDKLSCGGDEEADNGNKPSENRAGTHIRSRRRSAKGT